MNSICIMNYVCLFFSLWNSRTIYDLGLPIFLLCSNTWTMELLTWKNLSIVTSLSKLLWSVLIFATHVGLGRCHSSGHTRWELPSAIVSLFVYPSPQHLWKDTFIFFISNFLSGWSVISVVDSHWSYPKTINNDVPQHLSYNFTAMITKWLS